MIYIQFIQHKILSSMIRLQYCDLDIVEKCFNSFESSMTKVGKKKF